MNIDQTFDNFFGEGTNFGQVFDFASEAGILGFDKKTKDPPIQFIKLHVLENEKTCKFTSDKTQKLHLEVQISK